MSRMLVYMLVAFPLLLQIVVVNEIHEITTSRVRGSLALIDICRPFPFDPQSKSIICKQPGRDGRILIS